MTNRKRAISAAEHRRNQAVRRVVTGLLVALGAALSLWLIGRLALEIVV